MLEALAGVTVFILERGDHRLLVLEALHQGRLGAGLLAQLRRRLGEGLASGLVRDPLAVQRALQLLGVRSGVRERRLKLRLRAVALAQCLGMPGFDRLDHRLGFRAQPAGERGHHARAGFRSRSASSSSRAPSSASSALR